MRTVLAGPLYLIVAVALAQAQQGGNQPSVPAPDMQHMEHGTPQGMPVGHDGLVNMHPQTFLQAVVHHSSSGTSVEPTSTPVPMLMTMKGPWMLMFHGNSFLTAVQQSSRRGGDKVFGPNWFMPMAQRRMGPGFLMFRAMLSLDPATVTHRRYPLLFQEGEAAFGKPITDGQHPHDLFMELSMLYDWQLGESTLLSFYLAPIGDPALGPVAFPHRMSASENPVAPLGHHQQDSTHIASDVLTVGLTHRSVRIEASGFHGREPDENRWNIDQGKIDSWGVRLTVQPGRNWSGQYSYGRITSPEALHSDEDQERMTASAMYHRPLANGNWASTILWGRTRSLPGHAIFNSYLLESTVRFHNHNQIWTRIENVDRSAQLILGGDPAPPDFEETPIGRVQAYTFGYARDFNLSRGLGSGIGAQLTTYGVADTLKPIYGSHPIGIAMFVKFQPRGRAGGQQP